MKFIGILKLVISLLIVLHINLFDFVKCTVKKDQVSTSIPDDKETKPPFQNLISNKTELHIPEDEIGNVLSNSDNPFIAQEDMPDSFKTGFYLLMGAGLIGLCFIVYKAFLLRTSRAERRYGVQGDSSAQELTPLPGAMDEDSENEDQTIFEIP